MADRIMPTEPGWWWREEHGRRECVRVQWHALYPGEVVWFRDGRSQGFSVRPEDGWLAPVATPEEVDALRRNLDAARLDLRWYRGTPPDGWEDRPDGWVGPRVGRLAPAVSEALDGCAWWPELWDDDECAVWRGEAPVGLAEAMGQAKAALAARGGAA